MFPAVEPMRLSRRRDPFSHPDWIFEIKHDGFRAIAYVREHQVELVSRNGNTFKGFPELTTQVGQDLKVRSAILDGEIVCLDADGRSQFNDLLFRRGEPFFYAFDLLWADGEDLRYLPLHERKFRLKEIVKPHTSRLLYLDHVEERGEDFFELACEHDLEGIIAKHKCSPYQMPNGETSWVKIRNPRYSQIMGRDELFEKRSSQREHASDGWAGCVLACEEQGLYT